MVLLPQPNNHLVLQLQCPFERNATNILLPPQPTYDELSDEDLVKALLSLHLKAMELVRKNLPDKVLSSDECQTAFGTVCSFLSSDSILAIQDMDSPFAIRTSASDYGVCAVLLQSRDDVLMPCRYATKTVHDCLVQGIEQGCSTAPEIPPVCSSVRLAVVTFIRPVFEYANPVLNLASRTSLEKLDRVQNAALRLVLRALWSTPIAILELAAGCEPLGLRRGEQTVFAQERYF
ncbi:DNA/RNA polymerases superfamily protein [Plakobranchus ocellatus]|uniref:DNA/RNA polymerases superfamily protein n=1 Tax=Plakobranchus ocellatus TaxID=259542 RepID=A0AAV3Y892_9GAST|nr:DNA/RNA polymerases superfamily protein [Plakobranchus ocellatus]